MRVLIFAAFAAVGLPSVALSLVVSHIVASLIVKRRRTRRDDLMALADSLAYCGHIGRASEPGHLWHVCHLPRAHDAGPAPLHYCRCGVRWVTPAYVSHEISALEAMLDDPVEPDGRTR